jgi:hypothetical protein
VTVRLQAGLAQGVVDRPVEQPRQGCAYVSAKTYHVIVQADGCSPTAVVVVIFVYELGCAVPLLMMSLAKAVDV